MKKLFVLCLPCAITTQLTFAQEVDITFLLLDKAPITTGILYPHFSSDSNALWFKFDGAKDTLLSFRVSALIIRTQNHHLLDTLRKNSATRSDSFFS